MLKFGRQPRRLVAGFLLSLFLLVGPSFAYSFAVFGDCQGNYAILKDLIGKLKQEKGLDFVVSVGDVVPYGEEANYLKYKKMMATLDLPLYQAIGNHDAVKGGWKNFLKYFGPLYYSFEYQGDRFIVLDNSLNKSFDGAQFAWLKGQLGKEGARHKFVIMHKPVFDPSEIYKDHVMSGRAVTEELIGLFTKYKVDYVLAGHVHGYAKSERDGVTYIVSAGAGGPLYLPPEFGGFYNYVRIDVDGNRITDRVKRVYE
ncbi:MAG: metallophosphoesterase [Candidatus Margulisbacteria bacterium]|nr:metallophosphoesterase [Candidatus Margulisiibacteriota bacterium]